MIQEPMSRARQAASIPGAGKDAMDSHIVDTHTFKYPYKQTREKNQNTVLRTYKCLTLSYVVCPCV